MTNGAAVMLRIHPLLDYVNNIGGSRRSLCLHASEPATTAEQLREYR
jgi:hypothetical protein